MRTGPRGSTTFQELYNALLSKSLCIDYLAHCVQTGTMSAEAAWALVSRMNNNQTSPDEVHSLADAASEWYVQKLWSRLP